MSKCNFVGWATRYNVKCTDGRVILKDAFKHNDGKEVPLVWNHQHNDPSNILGKAILEYTEEGMLAHCSFNDTENGQRSRKLVEHGDITQLSIFANQLRQRSTFNAKEVMHGDICEVSLVLKGANPEAFIESVIRHSADGEDVTYDDEFIFYSGEEITLVHSDDEDEDKVDEETAIESESENLEHAATGKTVKEIFDTLSEVQKNAVYELFGAVLIGNNYENLEHSGTDDGESGETVGDIFNTLSDKQKDVVYGVIAQMFVNANDQDLKHSQNDEIEGGNDLMKENVFDQSTKKCDEVLSHSDMEAIISDAKRNGSMKEAVLAHGITDMQLLFPEEHALNNVPTFISGDLTWVKKVMNGVHKSPFSKIRALFADITADAARAKGYIKGTQKKEEVFALLKRTTSPQTVYKLQKMDRDDIIDITTLDVVAFIKAEMRIKLEEELARAILVGDGRLADAEDKIKEEHIRPIWTDEELYAIHSIVDVEADATMADIATEFIDQAVRAREEYDGSGSPKAYMAENLLSACLLLKDGIGHRLYKNVTELATAMMVSEIVTVPPMKGLTRTDADGKTRALLGIIVNLDDYTVGADKGGAVTMFDDFDIDFNKYAYLIETRCSGSLLKPKSSIVLERFTEAAAG